MSFAGRRGMLWKIEKIGAKKNCSEKPFMGIWRAKSAKKSRMRGARRRKWKKGVTKTKIALFHTENRARRRKSFPKHRR